MADEELEPMPVLVVGVEGDSISMHATLRSLLLMQLAVPLAMVAIPREPEPPTPEELLQELYLGTPRQRGQRSTSNGCPSCRRSKLVRGIDLTYCQRCSYTEPR